VAGGKEGGATARNLERGIEISLSGKNLKKWICVTRSEDTLLGEGAIKPKQLDSDGTPPTQENRGLKYAASGLNRQADGLAEEEKGRAFQVSPSLMRETHSSAMGQVKHRGEEEARGQNKCHLHQDSTLLHNVVLFKGGRRSNRKRRSYSGCQNLGKRAYSTTRNLIQEGTPKEGRIKQISLFVTITVVWCCVSRDQKPNGGGRYTTTTTKK